MKGTTLTVDIGVSRLLTGMIVAAHLMAAGALLLADLPWTYRVSLLIAIAAGLGFAVRAPRALRLRGRADGGLDIWTAGDWQAVRLLPDTMVLSRCMVLRYQRPGRRWAETRVILPDSLAENDFRRLRVRLRFQSSGCVKPMPQ